VSCSISLRCCSLILGERIITCTDVSALPFPLPSDSTEDEMKDHRKEVRRDLADLQPWALVYYGEPGEIAITLQERFFPSVRVIRIHTDLGVHEMAYLHPDTLTDKVNSSAGNLDEALNALRKNSAANPRQPQLRIRSHHRYRTDIERDRPGQMYVKWSVSHYGPAMMVERESCGEVDLGHLEYMEDDFKYWLRDNLVSVFITALRQPLMVSRTGTSSHVRRRHRVRHHRPRLLLPAPPDRQGPLLLGRRRVPRGIRHPLRVRRRSRRKVAGIHDAQTPGGAQDPVLCGPWGVSDPGRDEAGLQDVQGEEVRWISQDKGAVHRRC
jgi:hypothetical protein